jgi:hypothetical protein
MFTDTSPLLDEVSYELPRKNSVESFGSDFNLIRAVSEHAPNRLAVIDKRLNAIEQELAKLRDEREILVNLIAVVKPAP